MREPDHFGGRHGPPEGPRPPAAVRHSLDHRVFSTVVALAMLALMTQAIGLVKTARDIVRDVALLRVAMRSADGTPVDAEEITRVLPQGTPSGFEARALSEIAQVEGRPVTAETWLIHGLADGRSAFLSQFELCLLYWNTGRRAQARETCRDTTASAQYWLNRGYEAAERGDAAEALTYYEMASSVDPNLVAAWHQLGRTLFAAGWYDQAVLAYERVMALDEVAPADVFDSLGLAYLKLGNPTMARDVMERGLSLYPGERTYYLNIAASYRAEGDLETADSWYARMLQRWPGDAQAWASRAATAAEAGRLNDAVTYYREATNLQPQGVGYWMNLAAVATSSGDIDLATEAYERVIALEPENVANLLHAGRFFAESGQPDAARDAFERALVLQPDNGEAATQLSELSGTTQP